MTRHATNETAMKTSPNINVLTRNLLVEVALSNPAAIVLVRRFNGHVLAVVPDAAAADAFVAATRAKGAGYTYAIDAVPASVVAEGLA